MEQMWQVIAKSEDQIVGGEIQSLRKALEAGHEFCPLYP